MPPPSSSLLAYTPMFHSRLFASNPKYRSEHFEPLNTPLSSPPDPAHQAAIPPTSLHLDGNPRTDRPLIVQFCSNDPTHLLDAAKHVAPFCDAVDLNLGCPQGIARKGHYGAFLQEDWPLIHSLIHTLHTQLPIPVTAKFRIQETREKTLAYARMILDAGASIITVHGRRREQKGHATGLADWDMIRYLRDNLPPDTVIFANGNILQHGDIADCLAATGADGVMSAEGNLYDPTIFAPAPPVHQSADNPDEDREYWRGRDGRGGYRMDAVLRRYLDLIYTHVLGRDPPPRNPLFLASDPATTTTSTPTPAASTTPDGPPTKKQKTTHPTPRTTSPNLSVIQPHLFHLLRPLVSRHTHVRDALARARGGDLPAFEHVLALVEAVTREGLLAYARDPGEIEREMEAGVAALRGAKVPAAPGGEGVGMGSNGEEGESSLAAVERCRRPWWVCQAYVRPLPAEALRKGAMTLSKKDRKAAEAGAGTVDGEVVNAEKKERLIDAEEARARADDKVTRDAGLVPEGRVVEERVDVGGERPQRQEQEQEEEEPKQQAKVDVPVEGMVCG